MNNYVDKALKQFLWKKRKDTFGPTPFKPPEYGKKVQYVEENESARLEPAGIKEIQKVTGKFLYNSRGVDITIAHALNELNVEAKSATEDTKKALEHLMDYLATNPDAQIIYRASDMQLVIDSDAAYLNAPKSRSRAGGYHFLGTHDEKLFNGPIFVLAKTIKAVMASAAEAEVGSLFLNAQQAISYIITLEELGHPQKAVPLFTDNSTATGFLNGTIKKKRSKAFDMRFEWLIDRIRQNQFKVKWGPGKTRISDYFTKRYPGSYHKTVRPIFSYIKGKSPDSLQGCVEILRRACGNKCIVPVGNLKFSVDDRRKDKNVDPTLSLMGNLKFSVDDRRKDKNADPTLSLNNRRKYKQCTTNLNTKTPK